MNLHYNNLVPKSMSDSVCIEKDKEVTKPKSIDLSNVDTGNKYKKVIYQRDTGEHITVDVYDVCAAFGVSNASFAHAVKKLLCAGSRGVKDTETDLFEAINSIYEGIKLEKHYVK